MPDTTKGARSVATGVSERPNGQDSGGLEEVEKSILDAAYDEFSVAGVQRANMEDVALRAGVSRATLYRRFPNKNSLLQAVSVRAGKWGLKKLDRMLEGLSPHEVVVTAFCEYTRELSSVPFFKELLGYSHGLSRRTGHEKALADLFLSENLVAVMIDGVASRLRRAGATMPDSELRMVAELQLRVAMSFVMSPSSSVDIRDRKAVAAFVRKHLAPMVY
ncbi:MAG: TetR/AcrR family transcriptional regulator [Segniliparus sp.]|uniref:TetR/AcrR family transcriptional regulator n=1 Tax=Segniliparus sp. TaxID=2804064 RepID=UPI003F38B742